MNPLLSSVRIDEKTGMASVIDTIRLTSKVESNVASNLLGKFLEKNPSYRNRIKVVQINQMGRPTPIANAATLAEITIYLDSPMGKDLRKMAASTLVGTLAGSESLSKVIEERRNNATALEKRFYSTNENQLLLEFEKTNNKDRKFKKLELEDEDYESDEGDAEENNTPNMAKMLGVANGNPVIKENNSKTNTNATKNTNTSKNTNPTKNKKPQNKKEEDEEYYSSDEDPSYYESYYSSEDEVGTDQKKKAKTGTNNRGGGAKKGKGRGRGPKAKPRKNNKKRAPSKKRDAPRRNLVTAYQIDELSDGDLGDLEDSNDQDSNDQTDVQSARLALVGGLMGFGKKKDKRKPSDDQIVPILGEGQNDDQVVPSEPQAQGRNIENRRADRRRAQTPAPIKKGRGPFLFGV